MADSFTNPRYTLFECLGKGGMGEVYRAFDRLTGKYVALKWVTASTGDVRLALALEFRTLAGLRHPNIVSVLDYGFDDDKLPYFSMQLIENAQPITIYGVGKSLPEKVSLVVQMLQALTYLHRRGIIHRDLKPGNVMVTADGAVKVMDFGLAQVQGQEGGVAGTVAYMAPELFADQPAAIQSDLYAVGVMAYELFTGRHPFDRGDVAQLLNDALTKEADLSMLSPALGLVMERLLAKRPQNRYTNAETAIENLCEATGQPIPVEGATVRDSFLQAAQFVGRNHELGELLDAFERITGGKNQGSAWLVGGESGVGKSRLLEELRIRALIEGAVALQGQAVMGGGLPYQLWRDPVRWLMLATPLSDLEAGVLKEIVPDASTLLGRDIPDAPSLEGQSQQRLIMTIADAFMRQNQPLVLLLEDLQWSEKSLPVLQHLTTLVQRLPLLIIATYRNDERPDLPAQLPDMNVMLLHRLDEDAIRALSQSMLGEAGRQPALLDLLKRETEGNAFFMVEVVRALAEDAGGLNMVGQRTLPATVLAGGIAEIVRRRLNRVPEWGQALLKFAATAGREIDLNILNHIIRKGLNPLVGYSVEEWLTACVNAAVLEAVGEKWRFSHDKLREGALHNVSPEELPLLHRHIAEAIETVYPTRDFALVLVKHWRGAGDVERELHYIQLAAAPLNKSSAYQEARWLLERGLSLLPENQEEETRLNLRLMLGEALDGLGDYSRARAIFTDALDMARRLKNPYTIATALRWIGWGLWRQGDNDGAERYLEESMQHYFIAGTLIPLGDVAWSRGDLETAEACYLRCLEATRDTDDLFFWGQAEQGLGTILWRQGKFEEAGAHLWRSIDIMQRIGYRRGVASSYNTLGMIAARLEDYVTSAQYYEQSTALYEAVGFRWGVSNTACNLAFVYLASGNLEKTRETLHKSLSISYTLDSLPVSLELLAGYAQVALLEGDAVWAAELVGLTANHPSTNDFTHDIRLAPLYPLLKDALPEKNYQAAFERGASFDLDLILRDLLTRKS